MAKELSPEEKKIKEEKTKTLENAGITGASSEVVQRYGSANQAFLGTYDGINYENGTVLFKSLKEESARYYSEVKANPSRQYATLKTHAGNAAEASEVAIENSKRIINKDPARRITTDDLDPAKGGHRNHPLYDHVDVDKNGNPIAGTESQMKIKGDTAPEAHDKLMEKGKLLKDGTYKNEKYLDNDVKLKVQKGFAEDIKKTAQENIKSLEKQEKALIGKPGKEEELRKVQRQIFKEKQIAKNVEDSNVSNQESKDSVLKPKTTTAKHTLETSHEAGFEAAKTGAAIAGSMSFIRNIVSVVKGEKEPGEAALAVIKDTGTGTVVSYTTAFAGSQLQAFMVKASTKKIATQVGKKVVEKIVTNTALKSLAESNLPAQVVTATLEVGKTMKKYFTGEIDGVECLTELGEKGTGIVGSAMGTTLGAASAVAIFGKSAVIGQLVIPIPVVGGLIGGMVGYALTTSFYNEIMATLKDAKLAREERIRIEAECAEAIRMIREYRAEMEKLVSAYMIDHIMVFHEAFDSIKDALQIGDVDGFISGANMITRKLGKTPQFETFDEFDDMMHRASSFKI
jgi:hypothetical protein